MARRLPLASANCTGVCPFCTGARWPHTHTHTHTRTHTHTHTHTHTPIHAHTPVQATHRGGRAQHNGTPDVSQRAHAHTGVRTHTSPHAHTHARRTHTHTGTLAHAHTDAHTRGTHTHTCGTSPRTRARWRTHRGLDVHLGSREQHLAHDGVVGACGGDVHDRVTFLWGTTAPRQEHDKNTTTT